MGLLYVALDETEQSDRTLGRVRHIIEHGANSVYEYHGPNAAKPGPDCFQHGGTHNYRKEEKLRSNVLASLQAHTHFLTARALKEAWQLRFRFEGSENNQNDDLPGAAGRPPGTFGRWLRLLMQQAITVDAWRKSK